MCFEHFSAITLYGFVTVVQPNQIIHLGDMENKEVLGCLRNVPHKLT